MKNKIIIAILLTLISIYTIKLTETNNIQTKAIVKEKAKKVTKKYKLTHYGWDCKGCGGRTATGYNVRKTIYYKDKKYGKVRIIATNKDIPLYSIVKIENYKYGSIIAIVLDRGVGKGVIDLLVKNEKVANKYGIQKGVKIKILRYGK